MVAVDNELPVLALQWYRISSRELQIRRLRTGTAGSLDRLLQGDHNLGGCRCIRFMGCSGGRNSRRWACSYGELALLAGLLEPQ